MVRQPTCRVTRLCLVPFSSRKDRWPIGSGYSSTIGVFLVATREGSQPINNPKTSPFDDFKPSDLLDFIRRDLGRLALLPPRVSAIFPSKLCVNLYLMRLAAARKLSGSGGVYMYQKGVYVYHISYSISFFFNI